ncbi:MAG: hypothetical protein PWR21_748, partial [Methanoculleus sp.]|nr:hypothetical protein [Methanoculleus sp.]
MGPGFPLIHKGFHVLDFTRPTVDLKAVMVHYST